MNIVCYYRHSTDSQQQDKNSIERQQFECQKHADKLGWNIIKEVQDKGQSGAGDKKNLDLLKDEVINCEISFDCLLVYDQSRLTRKSVMKMFQDIGFLADAGIGIACVDESDSVPRSVEDFGNDITTIIKGWKNHEDVLKAAAWSVSGLRSSHEQGRLSWIGPTPLGFDRITKDRDKYTQTVLIANDDLAVVTQVFDEFLSGASIRSLVPLVETASRYAGERNASPQSVKIMLRNPIYCGIWAFGVRNVGQWRTMNPKKNKNVVVGNVLKNAPSIIDYDVDKAVSKDKFLQVQTLLDSSKSRERGAPAAAGHRYTGLLKCASCGWAMIAHKRRWNKKGESQQHLVDYVCSASAQSGKKCRGESKPWRKAVSESDIDSELQIIFGTDIIWNAGFHMRLIHVLASELRTSDGGTSRFDKDLAELDIEEIKYNKSFQQSDGALPELIMQQWRELEERRKELELEKEKDSAGRVSEFVEHGIKSQAEDGSPQFARYLNGILCIAKKLAIDTEFNAEDELLSMLKETLFNPADGSEVEFFADDMDQLQGYLFPVDSIVALLRSMGLENFRLHWELGTKRGKPQQLLKAVELVFSWSDSVTGLPNTL